MLTLKTVLSWKLKFDMHLLPLKVNPLTQVRQLLTSPLQVAHGEAQASQVTGDELIMLAVEVEVVSLATCLATNPLLQAKQRARLMQRAQPLLLLSQLAHTF